MRRKLIALNAVLAVVLGLEWMQFTRIRGQFRERATRNLNQPIRPERAPALPPLPATQAVVIANYADVAIKNLFSRDRNPTVIPDPPAPPPPEKPMPPLPAAYGAIYFGEPRIILGLRGGNQRGYGKGETIGDFKVLDFDNKTIAFEWDGKRVEKRLDEIMAKPSEAPQQAPAQQAAAAPPPVTTTTTTVSGTVDSSPGADVGSGFRACKPGDASPSGTIKDGYRKVSTTTPFGPSCRWEAVK